MNKLLVKTIEDKKIVWFKESNSYTVFTPIVSEIFLKMTLNISTNEIEKRFLKKLNTPIPQAKIFLKDIYNIYKKNTSVAPTKETTKTKYQLPKAFFSEKKYSINNCIFYFQYETAYHELKIHPAFAHLETRKHSNQHFTYTFFCVNHSIVFLKNNRFIGKWNTNEAHFFEGKVSMQLLIDIYQKPEMDWMGVFHASAISYKKESLLLLGDSGNGKSTSLALLNANGFNCIADDFVPVDNQKNIHTYPAAISIKKKSVKTLLPYYPELENSAEYHFKKLNKTVRFLAPKKIKYKLKLKCKALIFIKYNLDIEIEINTLSKIEALQQLVPDSWISPLEKNVNVFLDWFLELPCYQLTYSNNQKMIESVSKIFNNEL